MPETITLGITQLSKEPGFVILEISSSVTKRIPLRTGGLLAFIKVRKDKEKVLRFLLCDDLAKGFRANRRLYRDANCIAYHVFSSPQSSDWKAYQIELKARLRLFARLSEKYDPACM